MGVGERIFDRDRNRGGVPLKAEELHRKSRIAHWDDVARRMEGGAGFGGAYHRRLEEVYRFLIPPGLRVLEVGCGYGDLLAAVKPAAGVGVDFSGEMIRQAEKRHPELRFVETDAHNLAALAGETYDAIILSDVLNDVWDVQVLLGGLVPLATPRTRVIVNSYSRLWE